MSLSVFPVLPGLTFTVVKTPEFNTLDMKSPNAYEVRIAQTINPVWNYTLIYDFLRDFPWGSFVTVSELRTMMGFFSQMSGKAASFLFTDPSDNYVGPALTNVPAPNTPLAQLALVNDGAGNYYSPIQRTLDGVFYEDVTDLNGSIVVYLNGSLASAGSGPSEYTVLGPGLALPTASYMGMYLQWGRGGSPWAPSHGYSLGNQILDPNGHIQQVTTAGTSGTVIPTFNDSGGTTEDPHYIIWTDEGNAAWAMTTAYTLGQVIIDPAGHVQMVTTAGTSSGSIPTFNDSGGTTPDGGTLVWTDQGNAVWAAATPYPLGSFVVFSGHAEKATQGGISGGSTPSFSTSGGTVNDPASSVIWQDEGAYTGPSGPVTAQFHFYFRVRFESDSLDFEQFTLVGTAAAVAGQGGGFYTIGGSESVNGTGTLKLVSARPVPL